MAAFNVARHILCEADAEELPLPNSLKKVIQIYLDSFSVDLQI